MPEPKPESFPKIRGALTFYKIAAFITGVMLLLLIVEMVVKYSPIHRELFAGGSGGLLWFAEVIPTNCEWYSLFLPGSDACEMTSVGDGTNLSTLILIAHGWFYVVYLFSCFRLWSLMRWRFPRFLLLALGGIVPLLSFIMEARMEHRVKTYLAGREAGEQALASDPDIQEAAR